MEPLDLTHLASLWQDALLQQMLTLALALFGGLLAMTLAARLEVTPWGTPGRALAAYRDETPDTPLERLGVALLKRYPALGDLLGLSSHRRWLALEGQPWSAAATVGLAAVLAAGGLALFLAARAPILLVAPFIGFILPFVRQRSAAERVRRRVQNTLPDVSAMLAAEMAAGNPPDRALARAADMGGPLARILREAIEEGRVTGRPIFSRGKADGLLLAVAKRYDLPALRAFVVQVDMAARTGAAGPQLMSALAHTLIIEYKDRALREAEALESRLAVPTVGFFFTPFLFLILTPLLLPVLNAL
jgi:Flp pilus assembly protein TadB